MAARAGHLAARTQSCVAVSGDGERWFLVNASPDLAGQLARDRDFHPRTIRGTPVEGVLVTNADLDHVLGLFSLRENGAFTVYGTPAVRASLADGLHLDKALQGFGGMKWLELAEEPQPLADRAGEPTGLRVRALRLPGGPPPYAPASEFPTGHSIALEFSDSRSRLLVAPDLAEPTPAFLAAAAGADAVLIDGTFWSDDELARIRPGARSASAMGHRPIGGAGGTLELMRPLSARFRAYVHINNTNPILRPGSPERAAVEAAGVTVPDDGWEFAL